MAPVGAVGTHVRSNSAPRMETHKSQILAESFRRRLRRFRAKVKTISWNAPLVFVIPRVNLPVPPTRPPFLLTPLHISEREKTRRAKK